MPPASWVNGNDGEIVGKSAAAITTISRIAAAPETAYSAGCLSPSTIPKHFTRRRFT